MAAQAAGASKQNEEGSIEHTVKSMLKMNLKKAGCVKNELEESHGQLVNR